MASVGSPALTMMMAVRGSRLSTNSSRVFAGKNSPSVPCSFMRLFGTGVGAVEHGDLVAVVSEIACEAAAHGSHDRRRRRLLQLTYCSLSWRNVVLFMNLPQCSPERTQSDSPSQG